MCGKGSQTTTSTSTPNPQALQAYSNLLNQAGQVAQNPFVPYTGEFTAPVNAQQQTAGANINQNAGFALPFIQQGAQYATQAAQPITAAQIAGFQSPYTQQVVNATEAQFNNQNQQQLENVRGNAAAQGALGGDREAVAEAITSGQQQTAEAPVIAGLYNQGYNTALSTALQEQQNLGQSAYSLGNLGVAGQNAALSGANAQLGYGTLQQSTQQAQDQALYNQFLAQQGYPFQTTQWLAGIDTGVGSQMGGTGTTTGPPPNSAAQWGGLGLAALGMFLKDGGGVRARAHGGKIPGFALGGMPYAGGSSYIPSMGLTMGAGAPKPPGAPGQGQQQIDPLKLASSTIDLEKKVKGLGNGNLFGGSDPSLDEVTQAGAESGMSPSELGFGAGGEDLLAGGGMGADMGAADMAMMFAARGGKVRGFAGGGLADDAGLNDIGDVDGPIGSGMDPDTERRAAALAGLMQPGDVGPRGGLGLGDIAQSYAPGFENNFGFDDSRASWNDAIRQSGDRFQAGNQYGLASADVVNPSSVNGQPQNLTGPIIPPGGTGPAPDLPPPVDVSDTRPRGLDVTAFAPVPGSSGAPAIPQGEGEKQAGFGSLFGGFGGNPKLGRALMSAGFAMMASRSPFLANAVGEGGLAGLSAYAGQEKAGIEAEKTKASIEDARKKLEMHADEFAKKLALDTKKIQQNEEHFQKQQEAGKVPQGYERVEGGLRALPGGPADPEAAAKLAAAKKPQGATLPAEAWSVHGDDFLNYLPPEKRNNIVGVAHYEVDPKSMSVTGGHREEAMNYAKQYDPSFDQKTYNERYNAINRFATGPQGNTVRSLNVAIEHLDTLDQLGKALNNGNAQVANSALNYLQRQFGDPRITNFNLAKQVVADEVLKAVIGSGAGTMQDREELQRQFSAANSPQQMAGVIATAQALMAGQMRGLEQQYRGATGLTNFEERYLSPHTRERLNAAAPGGGGAPAGAPAGGRTLTQQDQAALQWANANPNDPRAAQIKQRLGVQ